MNRTIKKQLRPQTAVEPYVPLAARLRPQRLEDFVGQEKVLGPGTALRRAIEQGNVGSLILWGPPGVGKTTLAELIARKINASLERVSAVTAGVKDLKEIIDRAKLRRTKPATLFATAAASRTDSAGQRTVLIVDEIHRFNKAQQDVLLPAVEEGIVTLLGATTENPYFEVIAALVSRAEVVRLESHAPEALAAIINRALTDKQGFSRRYQLASDAQAALVTLSGGDARRALNILERAVGAEASPRPLKLLAKTGAKVGKNSTITKADIESAAQQRVVQYDKAGDAHYDTISAFIKSLRGSDPDAALFYLFRMLAAGEDPRFIMRRMLIFASEDIGNADPHALMLAAAASQALEWVGLPEAEFALAHAATYLAAAPKSNSVYVAKEAAKTDVMQHGNAAPPGHIVNAPIADLKKHGKGVGYKYPHDFPGHVVAQQYRPDVIQNNIYYEPGEEGFEREVRRRIEHARQLLHKKAPERSRDQGSR